MYLDEHFDFIGSLDSQDEQRRYVAELAEREPQTAERLSLMIRDTQLSDRPLAAVELGTVIDGKYRLTELIGRGSSGVVWKAEAVAGLPAVYALKLFPASGYDAAAVVAEAETVVQLEDPRILKVFDYGRDGDGGPPYIVMEFIAGQSLDKAAPIDPATAIELMIDTCTAVAAAHRKNVLHRDLKPHNLIHTTDGRLKVVDFGIALRGTIPTASAASATTDTMTMTLGNTRVVGTPAYIAPEVLAGGSATERSDIYSLGATFFHLLSGEQPYRPREGSEIPWLDIVDQVLDDTHASLPKLVGVKRRLERIIRRAMARDPWERYDSVDQLRRDLELYRSKLPTMADGRNLLFRLELFGERRKGLLLLASFLLSLSLAASQLVGQFMGTLHGLEEERRASASAYSKLESQLVRAESERDAAMTARDAEFARAEALRKSSAQLSALLSAEKNTCAERERAQQASQAQALGLIGELTTREKDRADEVLALTSELTHERTRRTETEQSREQLTVRVSALEVETAGLHDQIDAENELRADQEKKRLAEERAKRKAVGRRMFSSTIDYLTR